MRVAVVHVAAMVARLAVAFAAAFAAGCATDALTPGVADAGGALADAAPVSLPDAAAMSPPDATVSPPDAAPVSPPDAAALDADVVAPDGGVADAGTSTLTRYPIVLVHGWAASDTVLGFAAVGQELGRVGHRVHVATVPPFDAPAVRATFLATQVDMILAASGAGKVNLIAHSMGGLDGRHLITVLGYGDRVASLSTISTPHRGTAVADVVLGLQSGASTVAVDALAAIFGARISDVDSDPQLRASLRALSEDEAPAFNAAHPDDPRVFYQSWAGLSNVRGIPSRSDESACEDLLFDPALRDVMDRLLVPLAAMAAHGLRVWPNDGLVPVSSAKWGLYHGCLPADHADEVGAFDDVPPDAVTGFDYLAFYRDLARDLAARGF